MCLDKTYLDDDDDEDHHNHDEEIENEDETDDPLNFDSDSSYKVIHLNK